MEKYIQFSLCVTFSDKVQNVHKLWWLPQDYRLLLPFLWTSMVLESSVLEESFRLTTVSWSGFQQFWPSLLVPCRSGWWQLRTLDPRIPYQKQQADRLLQTLLNEFSMSWLLVLSFSICVIVDYFPGSRCFYPDSPPFVTEGARWSLFIWAFGEYSLKPFRCNSLIQASVVRASTGYEPGPNYWYTTISSVGDGTLLILVIFKYYFIIMLYENIV